MSYNIKSIGKKADVIATVKATDILSDGLKDFFVKQIEAIPDPAVPPAVASWEAADSVYLEASGHEPGTHLIKLERFNAAAPPPPPPSA